MGKVAIYIDGYNVYSSIKRWKKQSGESLLWVDYWKLSTKLVEQSPLVKAGDELVAVNYYTATRRTIPKENPAIRIS